MFSTTNPEAGPTLERFLKMPIDELFSAAGLGRTYAPRAPAESGITATPEHPNTLMRAHHVRTGSGEAELTEEEETRVSAIRSVDHYLIARDEIASLNAAGDTQKAAGTMWHAFLDCTMILATGGGSGSMLGARDDVTTLLEPAKIAYKTITGEDVRAELTDGEVLSSRYDIYESAGETRAITYATGADVGSSNDPADLPGLRARRSTA